MTPSTKKRAPVKVGCLSCRASHKRCDGEPTCTNCVLRQRECIYTKSNRGGPRVSRKRLDKQPQQITSRDNGFDQFVPHMIDPGAGLKSVDSDELFDNIFGKHLEPSQTITLPTYRHYGSDNAILNAYYIYVHPYFPILPPPVSSISVDDPLNSKERDFEPSSPISLALSAILALIPHPLDPFPRSQESVWKRREQAELYSQLAMESIEIETEVIASVTSPADALSGDPSSFRREWFHPQVPVELESIFAHLILSAYEYAQRGNLVKMRNRAAQALDAATRLSLHLEDSGSTYDMYTEAKRRAWWMTYVCTLQGSIVSSTPPMLPIGRHNFSTPPPNNDSDPQAWSAFLDSQQLILKCTQYTVSLKKALREETDLSELHAMMVVLDQEIDSLTNRYDWNTVDTLLDLDAFKESNVARSLKNQAKIKLNSSRIKLHRYNAFMNKPLFTKRHCDLEQATSIPSCCGTIQEPSSGEHSLPSPPVSDTSTYLPSESAFIDVYSAKACMRSALEISKAFESLPYPDSELTGSWARSAHIVHAPRTMPAFACCAMQSSYALLMLCQKGNELQNSTAAKNGLNELYTGLGRVLAALQNYSMAFEAIDGMRAQVQDALEVVKHPPT